MSCEEGIINDVKFSRRVLSKLLCHPCFGGTKENQEIPKQDSWSEIDLTLGYIE
jgi:hypothetical protein